MKIMRGLPRKIDKLGRVCLPAQFRKVLDWELDSYVEFFAGVDRIFIYKFDDKNKKVSGMPKGLIRRIDHLGRATIPHEFRYALGLKIKDTIEVFSEDDRIYICKFNDKCVFCSAENVEHEFRGQFICSSCMEELNRK